MNEEEMDRKFLEYLERESRDMVSSDGLTLPEMAEALLVSMAKSAVFSGDALKLQDRMMQLIQKSEPDPRMKVLIAAFRSVIETQLAMEEGIVLITLALYKEGRLEVPRATVNAKKLSEA